MEGQEQSPQEQSGSENENMKSWLQENMRIILSIIIVIAIAGGVYSYSKRNAEDKSMNKNVAITQDENQDEEIMADENVISDENTTSEEVAATETESTPTENENVQQEDRTSSIATSQETGESFIETAGKGDGLTHLARRALANYLEKNPDSTLTPEHKIYIEDYLRKNVRVNNRMEIGTSVEFSKNLIQDAIGKSKELSEKQLQNLHQYSVRVPTLS